jgi:hypothetical protein
MRQRALAAGLWAAIVAAAMAGPAAYPGTAPTPAQAVKSFGLVGTWSPDCAGELRVIYAAPAGAAPTVRVIVHGSEVASSEIQAITALSPTRISWRSMIKTWSTPDSQLESWMPQPGEIWVTTLAKTDNKIRPLASQRQDGQKVSVRGGFIYSGEPVRNTTTLVWRSTGKATVPLERCPAGHSGAPG